MALTGLVTISSDHCFREIRYQILLEYDQWKMTVENSATSSNTEGEWVDLPVLRILLCPLVESHSRGRWLQGGHPLPRYTAHTAEPAVTQSGLKRLHEMSIEESELLHCVCRSSTQWPYTSGNLMPFTPVTYNLTCTSFPYASPTGLSPTCLLATN